MVDRILSRFFRQLAVIKRRMKLKNHTFSIISNTCIGGVITHAVGEAFRSPTVNLVIYEDDFLVFCQNLKEYANCPLEQPSAGSEAERYSNYDYPVGILRGAESGLPDIAVYFVHYTSFDRAREAWNRRFQRVNYNDIFLIMDRGMDATDDILDRFHQLPYTNKVFFTHKEDSQRWPNTFRFSYYTEKDFIVAHMYTRFRKGIFEYRILDEFDYVKWLNTGEISRTNVLK